MEDNYYPHIYLGGIMEIKIDSLYDAEQSRLKYVNKMIIERLPMAGKYYIIKESLSKANDGSRYFKIYKKPTQIKLSTTNAVAPGNLLFAYLKDNYFITEIRIKDDTIYSAAYTPNEVIIHREMLKYMFNSIDDLKIKIIKQYCDWEFGVVSNTYKEALEWEAYVGEN